MNQPGIYTQRPRETFTRPWTQTTLKIKPGTFITKQTEIHSQLRQDGMREVVKRIITIGGQDRRVFYRSETRGPGRKKINKKSLE